MGNFCGKKRTKDTVPLLKRELKKKQAVIEELQAEKDELLLRLSAVCAANMCDNNPNIADLSDVNRPTNLADRFSELYDNEWTDAFVTLTKDKKRTINDACLLLLEMLLKIYTICKDKSVRELKTAHQGLVTLWAVDKLKPETKNNLNDERKKNYKAHIHLIIKDFQEYFKKFVPDQGERECKSITNYVNLATELCWIMTVQDPPIYLNTSIIQQKGEIFDTKLYKDYTKSGKLIEFVVWPAIYICEGGNVLRKGVAQGTDKAENIDSTINNVDEPSHN